jgi:hypothetical protein
LYGVTDYLETWIIQNNLVCNIAQHNNRKGGKDSVYVGVLRSLWLFVFAAQPKEFFLDGLKKFEQ